MDKLKEYKVAFRGLGEGKHNFDYILDSRFFNCFEATKGTEANVKANVEIVKTALLMEVKINIDGTVKAICDRCLGMFDLSVKGEMNLYVKQTERDTGNDDDYIVVTADDDYLDLSSYLYETYMLNYPMRVVHKEGECEAEMEEVLDKYIVEEENKPTDSRWDELKKLINN
ncbi:YceD family protein [Odoribacter lunatus]|uniref:YceD family protein n=1 Tax=Odoribacter lunatus TaxID=2941335 RepID=UPI00204211CE|nr:DUF177 domain-containing protein [Odoribacter lunatus]